MLHHGCSAPAETQCPKGAGAEGTKEAQRLIILPLGQDLLFCCGEQGRRTGQERTGGDRFFPHCHIPLAWSLAHQKVAGHPSAPRHCAVARIIAPSAISLYTTLYKEV